MSDLIHQLGIDWKLLLAQGVNFAILLFLLKKFAYAPILAMLERRRREIEKGVEFTKAAQAHLAQADALKEEKLKRATNEALAIVRNAENDAKLKREALIQEAARKGEALMLAAKETIAEEKAKMGEVMLASAEEFVELGIAKVLGKLPKEERDRELIRQALSELRTAQTAK